MEVISKPVLLIKDERKVRLVITPHPMIDQGRMSFDLLLFRCKSLKTITDKLAIDSSWMVEVGGRKVPHHMWDKFHLKHGQVIEFRPLLQNKSVLRAVAFLVLTYYTMGAGNGWLMSATGATAGSFSAYAVGAAAFVVGATLVNRVLPIPTPGMMQLSTNKVTPTYSLSGGQNSMRLWEPMAIVWGQPYCVPDLASQPYTYFKGGKQILVQTFHAGINCQTVQRLRIGQTALSTYSDVSIYAKGFPDPPANSSPYLPSNNVDSIAGALLDFPSSGSVSVLRTTSPNTVKIEVDLELSLFTVNQTNGKYESKGVAIEALYSPKGKGEWLVIPQSSYTKSGTSFEIKNSTTDPLRITLSVSVDPGQYDVRLTKLTANAVASNEQNSVTWTQLKSYQPDLTSYPGQSLLAVWIQASGQLNGALLDFNWIATAKPAPIWNGTEWVTATNRANGLSNPGVQILQYARGIYDENNQLIAGLGWPDSRIDIEGLKKFMLWCSSNNFTFDAIIQRAMSHSEMLDVIAYAGMGGIGWPDGRLSVLFLDRQAPIEGVINMANIKAKSFSVNYSVSDRADEIEYGYFDRDSNNNWSSLRVVVPGVTMPTSTARLSNIGITSEAHAAVLARYAMAQNIFMTKSIMFEQDMEFLTYRKGTILALSHDLTQWGYGGRVSTVKNTGGFLSLMLDDFIPATGTNGEVSRFLGLRLQGETQYRIFNVQSFTGSVRQITLSTSWPPNIAIPNDNEALWIYDFKPTPGLKVLVTAIEPSDNQQGASVTVTPLPSEFWAYVDSGDYIPPERKLPSTFVRVTSAIFTEPWRESDAGGFLADTLQLNFYTAGAFSSAEVWAGIYGSPKILLAKTNATTVTWNASAGDLWEVEIRPFDSLGRLGSGLVTSHLFVGFLDPPDDVTGLTLSFNNYGGVEAVWNRSKSIGFKETVLKIGSDWASGTNEVRTTNNRYTFGFPPVGSEFSIVAKHSRWGGTQSVNAATSKIVVPRILAKYSPTQLAVVYPYAVTSGASARLLDDRIFACGGLSNLNPNISTDVYIFNRTTNIWSAGASMQTAKFKHSAAILGDGRVLVVGGLTFPIGGIAKELNESHIYDSIKNTWVAVASLPITLFSHNLVTLQDGRVFCCGGNNATFETDKCFLYNALTDVWTAVAPMPRPLSAPVAVLLKDGRVMVTGGYVASTLSKATYFYSPISNVWSTGPDMTAGRAFHSGVCLSDGRVFLTGGYSMLGIPSTEIFDFVTNSWTTSTQMPILLESSRAEILQNGSIFLFGGADLTGTRQKTNTCFLFNTTY